MPGITNKAKTEMLDVFFRNGTEPGNFYLALVTADDVPGPDTDVLGDLTEIPAGNGYSTGGVLVDRSSGGFPILIEEDDDDKGIIGLIDTVFTASAGPIPSGGNDIRYAVLTNDDGTIPDRKVYLWFDLLTDRLISDGQQLQINDMTAELIEA